MHYLPRTHYRTAWKSHQGVGERLKPWAIALFIVLAYGVVGTMDYEDAVAMEEARTATQTTTK